MDLVAELLQSGLGLVLVGILGLLVGSFLNVVIYRLPIMMEREEKNWAWEVMHPEEESDPLEEKSHHPDVPQEQFNLFVPASRCPHCQHKIRAWENIPVISWLIQGGKCRKCKNKISPRYLLVELLTAGLSVVVAWHFQDPLQVGFALIFTWALITLFFIDAETHYLPDRITLSLMWLGIAIAWYGDIFVDLHSSVLGAMIGYLSLWSVYWLFKLITGKEGMGHGDFKLLACLCAWQGPWMLPVILLIAPICALIFAVFARIGFNKAFAFGNFLSVTGWISLLYGGYIADWLGFFPG